MNKDELKAIFFSFYDQLLPEHAEKAKANYDPLFEEGKEPTDHADAINYGFEWLDDANWHSIHADLCDESYPLQLTPQVCTAKAKEVMYADPLPTDAAERKTSTLPDSGERSEFETGAVRDASEGKGFPSHLPTRALMRASKRFEDGAAKYTAHNWRKGIPLSRYIDSLNRHTWLLMQGDTSEDHLGAITWNALCLSETFDLIDAGKLPSSLNDLPELND